MFLCRFSVLAPARIRPGTKQNILLEGHKLSRPLQVGIAVYDYPVSQSALMTGSVTLKSKNNYSALKTIEVNLSMNVSVLVQSKEIHLFKCCMLNIKKIKCLII